MDRRKKNDLSLSDALKDFIHEHGLQKGMDKVNARTAWRKMMGNGINRYTLSVELQNDTLFVSLSSSVLREELSHGRSKIIVMLNEELGKEVIKKIILR